MCVCKGQVGLDEHLGEIAREHVQENWTTAKRSNLKARFRPSEPLRGSNL